MTGRVLDDWLLTPYRAAVHEPTATAVVADLHLGYGAARRRAGEAVPEAGADEAVAALGPVLAWPGVGRLVIAGDLVEGPAGAAVLPAFIDWLRGTGVELAGVVPGNHDHAGAPAALDIPWAPAGVRLGRWRVVHGHGPLPRGALALGHFHPWLRWGARASAPCYLTAPGRLVLPAFSPDAAGVNILGDPRWAGYRCHAIAGDRVLDFGPVGELARRKAKGGGRR